jgi:DNA-binding CsgD family transcriptional regulator
VQPLGHDRDEIIELIYKAAVDGSHWLEILERLRARTGSKGGMIMSSRYGHVDWICTPAMKTVMEAYAGDGWDAFNIRTRRAALLEEAGFLTDLDLVVPDEIKEHPFYTRFLHRLGMGWALGSIVRLPIEGLMIFHLERAYADGRFLPEHHDLMESLRVHIVQSLTLTSQRFVDRSAVALDVLGKLGLAAVALDESGRVLAGTPAGLALGEGGSTFSRKEGKRLVEAAFRPDRQPDEMFDATGASGSSAGLRREINGTNYSIDAVPLIERSVFTPKTALLVLRPTQGRTALDPQAIANRFHLTRTETDIALMIASGASVEAIAAHRAINPNTIRWHLKHIFTKMGVNRQLELVRLFTVGPA